MVSARQLARAYDLSVASMWRGDDTDDPLIAWLGGFRITNGPAEPVNAPDAVSLLGGGGYGIRWYSTPSAVIGFAAGRPPVCYRVPADATLPARPAAAPVETLPDASLLGAPLS